MKKHIITAKKAHSIYKENRKRYEAKEAELRKPLVETELEEIMSRIEIAISGDCDTKPLGYIDIEKCIYEENKQFLIDMGYKVDVRQYEIRPMMRTVISWVHGE